MRSETLAALVEQAPDALIYCDLDGVIQLWNAAAAAMFGHPASAALGQRLDMIIPARFRAAHWAGFHRAIDTGVEKYHGKVMTTRADHADGRKLYIDMSFGMIRDASGAIEGVLAIARRNEARAVQA